MKICRFFLTGLMLVAGLNLFAQKPKDFGIRSRKALNFYLDGLQQAQYRNRAQAIALFEQALEEEPDFAHAHYQLGVNAYVQSEWPAAMKHLRRTRELLPDEFGPLPYYLGVAYFYNARYDSAFQNLSAYLEQEGGRPQDVRRAQRLLPHARFAQTAIADSIDLTLENLGENINTLYDEYLPALNADGSYLLFTSRRPGSMGGYSSQSQDYGEDFYYSELKADSSWGEAVNLGQPVNTAENEGAATISEDGRIVIFTACNLPDGLGNCDLYMAVREGDEWSKPINLGPAVNSQSWDSQPCLGPGGDVLYFASGRAGGQGSSDIWYSRLVEGAWTAAKNLGEPVNTPGREDSPFLHADGQSLYFSSNYHLGFGGQDLFVSYRQQSGSWSEPQNLGYPLNTAAEESNLFVSTTGREGYINSDRDGGFGGSDLYRFVLAPEIRPQMATFLRGKVRDSLTQEPVYARIRLLDVESGDTVRVAFSDRANGRFLMSLPLDREYAAFVEAEGYLFASQNFLLKETEGDLYFDLVIDLSPIREGVKVELENIFFASGSYELEETSFAELKLLRGYLEQNPDLRIEIQGHTDDVGSDTDNLALSQNRAESVRQYLVDQGIGPSRIIAKGYGESEPIADNDTEEGRARNRRTEFLVISDH